MNSRTISHFRIVEKIGQGGMGEVYLADDTTLNRKVALKFLPEAFTGDPERMARFEREAKLLASLNHHNIAGIYGLEQADGNRFLVLEYVEGETLQAKLSKGALPLEDTLALCRQIAEGLEAAHEKGVIHRDLKPANVMITAEEKVKILDFGLAKALSDETQSIDSSQSPTLTEAMTRPGVILGTAAYMSPEQAKGKNADKRADIWAFGCILYECLTGKRAFEGETVTETLAAVIKEEPNFEFVPVSTRLVLQKCLAKERKSRLRDIADAMSLIGSSPEIAASVPAGRTRLAWSVAALLLAAFAAVSFIHFRERPPTPPETVRMQIRLTDGINVDPSSIALSPDGFYIAFAADGPNSRQVIWLRALNSLESRPLLDTESKLPINLLFWSPDSRSIAFRSEDKLKKIDITSGLTKIICDLPLIVIGGSWSRDDEIILGTIDRGMMHVPAIGGKLTSLTVLNPEQQESMHIDPVFLQDGQHFFYRSRSEAPENTGIYVGSLDSKQDKYDSRRVLGGYFPFKYVPIKNSSRGYLLYLRENTLMAQLLDAKSLKIVGESFPVAEQVASSLGLYDVSLFTVSTNGILVYQDISSTVAEDIGQELIWVNRQGKEISSAVPPGQYNDFRLYRDDKKIVFDRYENDQDDVWLRDLEREVNAKLTSSPGYDDFPIWSPDGLQVLFPSNRSGSFDLYLTAASGTEEEKMVVKMGTQYGWGTDWSKDGRFILYQIPGDKTGWDLWVAPQFDDQEPYPYLNTRFNESGGTFSPDGKWVAYVSNVTGRDEVYVQSFPRSDVGKTISSNGGSEPHWSSDGSELFYVAGDRNLMTTPVRLNPTFEPGRSKPLFPLSAKAFQYSYAVSSNAQRFLIVKQSEGKPAQPVKAEVIVNWQSGLKK